MRKILTIFVLVTLFLMVAHASPAQAQRDEPAADTQGLTLFTRYPAQEAAIGEDITIDLVLQTDTKPQIVQLEVQGLPEGWTALLRGGGNVIHAAYVKPGEDTQVELRLEPPADVAADTYRFTVVAQGERESSSLPIELTLQDKLPPSMTFEVELPTLRGAPETTFRYNVTLENEGDEDLVVNLLAETPVGFETIFKLSGQEVSSLPIEAGASKRLSIEVTPFANVPADTYPINITAQAGEVQATTSLVAEVTGKPELVLTTEDGRLSADAKLGEQTPLKIILRNPGSAPVQNVQLSASQPAGWEVTFSPEQIDEISAGQQVEATVNIRPAEQAIVGDYVVTVRARSDDVSTKSAEFRITVQTSTMWGAAGIGLVAASLVVVGVAVSRFGRR